MTSIVDMIRKLEQKEKEPQDSSDIDGDQQMVKEWVRTLDDLLLQHYLIHSKDVRTCPNKDCSYAGLVEIDPDTERIECSNPLQCEKCDTKWKDPLQRET